MFERARQEVHCPELPSCSAAPLPSEKTRDILSPCRVAAEPTLLQTVTMFLLGTIMMMRKPWYYNTHSCEVSNLLDIH